ncbi:MAG: UDP-N-acetylglucosamine 2-epimerase (hydrolyzing), partial [Gammaproteobacteria bacterium]|nr:UDP-N-acetylglucosamine 2-epimerase (hydrolyzing) [Gammaproteobacteria bacterium]
MKRKIAVVTGSRAEYGLLRWLMQDIVDDAGVSLQTIVTGMHLSSEFGLTYQLIEQDGFTIDAKVHMLLASDDAVAITKSVGLATIGFADAFARLKPDIVVVLGDRFEILAVAQAALIMKIPLAHIHGGEVTEGAIDESIRHAVTKMAHIHFAATEVYRQRIIQMGEAPARVFNVGAPGLDHLKRTPMLSKQDLQQKLNVKLSKQNALITYHPVTIKRSGTYQGLYALLEALDHYPDLYCIFTGANADEGGLVINRIVNEYLAKWPERGAFFMSLGSKKYLSLLNTVDIVIGNSSSGLIEVPAFKIPTVNLGERQTGRLRASTVIDCDETVNGIVAAIDQAFSPDFQVRLNNVVTP